MLFQLSKQTFGSQANQRTNFQERENDFLVSAEFIVSYWWSCVLRSHKSRCDPNWHLLTICIAHQRVTHLSTQANIQWQQQPWPRIFAHPTILFLALRSLPPKLSNKRSERWCLRELEAKEVSRSRNYHARSSLWILKTMSTHSLPSNGNPKILILNPWEAWTSGTLSLPTLSQLLLPWASAKGAILAPDALSAARSSSLILIFLVWRSRRPKHAQLPLSNFLLIYHKTHLLSVQATLGFFMYKQHGSTTWWNPMTQKDSQKRQSE